VCNYFIQLIGGVLHRSERTLAATERPGMASQLLKCIANHFVVRAIVTSSHLLVDEPL
jgi:hypothetical protein